MATSNANNYIPIEQSTFQCGCRPPARILGRAGLKIATLQTGSHPFVLISVEPANLCCVQCLRGLLGLYPHSKHSPILSAMVGPDESIHMAKFGSLSHNNCN